MRRAKYSLEYYNDLIKEIDDILYIKVCVGNPCCVEVYCKKDCDVGSILGLVDEFQIGVEYKIICG